MNWWVVGGIVWLVLALWCWCIVRVGALADQQIEDWLRENDEGA